MLTRKEVGIAAVLMGVPAVVGFALGVVTGGAYSEQPWSTERQMVQQHLKANDKKHDTKPIVCSVVAWYHDEPVDEKWFQNCLTNFDDSTKDIS
jgi:hypothetical protein